jgi:multiple sugar transport system substrate-binding protein
MGVYAGLVTKDRRRKRPSCLAALMILGLGCGESEEMSPDTTPVSVTYLRHSNPAYVKADGEFFANYAVAVPGVTVNPRTLPYKELGGALLTDLKAGRLDADLVSVIPSWVCTFADQLADVPDDILSLAQAQEAYFPGPLAGSVCGGKLKGLPLEYNLEYGGVVVNLDKYQAKYPGRTPSWPDWATFIAEASSLSEYDTSQNAAANGLEIAPDWPQPAKHIFFGQILQRGGKYWSGGGDTFDFNQGARFDFNTQEARDALTEMVKWVVTNKIMFPRLQPERTSFVTTRLALGSPGYGWNDLDRPLTVMGYAGTWALRATLDQLPTGSTRRYGFYAIPPMVGSQHRFVQNSGWSLVVPRRAKHSREAWALAKAWVLSPEAMRAWAASAGTLPALRANGTPAMAAGTVLGTVQPLLEQGRWVGYIPATAIETVEGTIVSNFFAAIRGEKTITEALESMQQTANAALMAP